MFKNKNIFVALTYKCNAFCKKCMTRYHVNRSVEMDEIVISRLLELLKANNYTGIVSVGTGEPLLYHNLDLFIDGILNVSDTTSLRLLTNGMLLCEDNNPLIFNKRCKWGVTMDAFEQATLQGLQKGVDTEQVKHNVSAVAKKYGPEHLYLNFTVYRNNIEQILPFCKFAVDNGISEIYLTELKVFKGYEKDLAAYRVIHDSKLDDIICEAKEFLVAHNIDTRGINFGEKHYREKCYNKCIASPVIDVDGMVSFCSGREDVYVGNILEQDIEDRWRKFAGRLNSCDSSWCNGCYDRMLADGNYLLPKTIRREC